MKQENGEGDLLDGVESEIGIMGTMDFGVSKISSIEAFTGSKWLSFL